MRVKVGKQYRIKDYGNKEHPEQRGWNDAGRMHKWMGRIVTIKEIKNNYRCIIEEDAGENTNGTNGHWFWNLSNFEPINLLEDELFEI